MGNRFVLPFAAAFVLAGAGAARADEGIERITTLGERELVAQLQKNEKARSEPKYKSVEQEQTSNDPFQGKPYAQGQNIYGGIGFDYFDAFGLQARYAARVIEEGFIEGLNNSFYVEGGLGLTFYGDKLGKRGVTGFGFVITGRWDFQMDPQWVFFADLGFGFNSISNGLKAEDVRGGGFFPAAGVGLIYSWEPQWGVRADLSYQFLGAGILYRF